MHANVFERPVVPDAVRLSLARKSPPDTLLFASVAALVGIGLMMIFSASSATAFAAYHDTAYYLKRQLMWLVVGLIAAFVAYRCVYRR